MTVLRVGGVGFVLGRENVRTPGGESAVGSPEDGPVAVWVECDYVAERRDVNHASGD